MDLQIEITNLHEVIRQLKKFNDKLTRKMMIRGMRKSARPMVKEARAQAPPGKYPHKVGKKVVNPGNLRRSIGIKTGRDKINPTIWLGSNMKRGVDAFYHHIVIGGSRAHQIPRVKGTKALKMASSGQIVKSVNHPGTSPNDYIERAFNIKKGEFISKLAGELDNEIQKQLKK